MQKTPLFILIGIAVIVTIVFVADTNETETTIQETNTPQNQELTPIDTTNEVNEEKLDVKEIITESPEDNPADTTFVKELPIPTEITTGTYTTYSTEKLASSNGEIIMHFSASWCPSCRALKADINSKLDFIPRNVTIFDVDYDTETTLKQKYGITTQHSFAQVDKDGNLIKKWSGSPTLESLVSELD